MLCSENAHYKSSVLPFRFHALHCTPSESRQVWPRWSAPCWCRFDYSTHTCEVLSSSFERNDSPSMLQEVWERVEMWTAHVSLCCLVVGCVSSLVAICLNICSKLIRNTTFIFFRIFQWFCFISNLSHTQFDGLLGHIVPWQ